MKKILFLLFLIPIITFSQPKKANIILIKDVTLKEVISKLLDRNYFLDRVDTVNNIITTQQKNIKGVSYIFNFRVKDNTAYLSGMINDNIEILSIKPSFSEIKNIGIKGSENKAAFDVLHSIALSFNKPLDYEVE